MKGSELRLQLADKILDDESIEMKKSRYSGEDSFYLGSREIAHFHSDGEIDIRVTRSGIRKLGLLVTEDPRFTVRSKSSDWVEFRFKTKKDLIQALELVAFAVEANR